MKAIADRWNDCSERLCPNDCSGNGLCQPDGTCACHAGYSKEDCSYRECPNGCSEHGRCDQPSGTCMCYPGWEAADCAQEECPNLCSGRGKCEHGCCVCEDGWTGVDCTLRSCPMDCSGRGTCDYTTGVCQCFAPYSGAGCYNMLPPRVVAINQVNTKAAPIPLPLAAQYEILTRVEFGTACNSSSEWENVHRDGLVKVFAELGSVSTDDMYVTALECQKDSERGDRVTVQLKTVAPWEEAAQDIQRAWQMAFALDKVESHVDIRPFNFRNFHVLSDPVIVAPTTDLPIRTTPKSLVNVTEVENLEVDLVLDMQFNSPAEWRERFEDRFQHLLGTYFSMPDEAVNVLKIERGEIGVNNKAVMLKVVVVEVVGFSRRKASFDEAVADGKLAEQARDMLIPVGDMRVLWSGVARKTSDDLLRECPRCKQARDRAMHELLRSGDSSTGVESSLKESCARGCGDYCTATCKRYHEPKEKTCMARRTFAHKYGLAQAAPTVSNAMQPSAAAAQAAAEVSNLVQVGQAMERSIHRIVDEREWLSLAQVQGSTQVESISMCFTQCSHTCVEECLGQWTDTSSNREHRVQFDGADPDVKFKPWRPDQ